MKLWVSSPMKNDPTLINHTMDPHIFREIVLLDSFSYLDFAQI